MRTILIAILACVVVVAVFVTKWAYRRIATANPNKPVGQAFVLGYCVLLGIFGDETVLRLFPLPDALYRINYAQKWEILALLATAIITVLYWVSELKGIRKVREPQIYWALSAVVGAIVFLIFAMICLTASLWVESESERLWWFGAHVALVWFVSVCFLVADHETHKGIIAEKDDGNELKNVSEMNYWLSDWPVVTGLFMLGVYCLLHRAEHAGLAPLGKYLNAVQGRTDGVNVWLSTEYFLGGAIAFQYLASTTIYLILAWGLIKLTFPIPPPAGAAPKPQEMVVKLTEQ